MRTRAAPKPPLHEDLMVCAGCHGPVLLRMGSGGPATPVLGWVHTRSGTPCPYSGAVIDLRTRHDWPQLGDEQWAGATRCR